MTDKLRIGIVGAGANTRQRHIPGLLEQEAIELVAVCNRRPESTAQVASAYNISKTYSRWEDLVEDPNVDAVVIGTWPYLHCPITLAALKHGKHVLCEARMCMNASEAHQMLEAASAHPNFVTQLVPSPFGLKGHRVMLDLLEAGFLGASIREVQVTSFSDALQDPNTSLSWRQDATLSGVNMLTLGIVHETLLRWLAPPIRVQSQAQAFVPSRIDPESGVRRGVGTPDSVQVLTQLATGARVSYHFSGVAPFGRSSGITLYGTDGVLHYDLNRDRIFGANRESSPDELHWHTLPEIAIPEEKAQSWQVEREFIDAIRLGTPVSLTSFSSGVDYMEFTEAVALSAEQGIAIDLPLYSDEEE